MKKKSFIIAALLLSILITIGIVIHFRVTNIEGTLNFYITENKEFFYFDEKSLYGLSEDGQVFYEVKKEDNILWYELVVDRNRNIYVLAEEYDGNQKIGNSVIVYHADGSSEKLYESKVGILSNIGYSKGFVTAFILDLEEGKQIELWKYNVKSKKFTESVYELKEHQEIAEIIYTATGDIYYLTSEAKLCVITPENVYSEITLDYGTGEIVIPYLDGGFSADLDGNVYFTDGYNFEFVRYNCVENIIEKVYEREQNVTSEYTFWNLRYMRYMGDMLTAVSPSVFRSVFGDNNFYLIISSFSKNTTISEKSIMFSTAVEMAITTFFLSIVGISLLFFVGYGAIYVIRHLRSLLLKQILVIIPLSIVIVLIIVTSLKLKIFEVLEKDAYLQLYTLTTSIIKMIDADKFEAVNFPREHQESYYKEVDNMINLNMEEFHELFPDILEKKLYYSLYVVQNGYSYVCFENAGSTVEARQQIGLREELYNPITEDWYLFQDPKNHTYVEHGSDDEWFYYARVITNKENKIVGYLEVGFDKYMFEKEIQKIGNEISFFVVLLLVVMVCFIMVSLHQSLKNLRLLKNAVVAVSDGYWETTVDIHTHDEMEDIGNAFNRMSYRVSKYLDSIVKLNTAYERFVPNKIFHLLGKETILDVKLGDKVIRKLGIMSVFIQQLDEMNKAEMGKKFELINQILGDIADIINDYSGIIETFQGSSVRAIYMNSVDEAIDTALHIIEKINNYQDKELINLSINVQYGDVILGVVGDNDRLDTTIVSEDVDFIYTLNKFSISNQTRLLITKEVYEKIMDKLKYNFRYLGKLEQTNTNRIVDLSDLVDAYSFYDKTNKLLTKELFEKGVELFILGNFTEARKKFIDVIRIDSNDEVAKRYLFLCDEYRNKTVEHWKGIFN